MVWFLFLSQFSCSLFTSRSSGKLCGFYLLIFVLYFHTLLTCFLFFQVSRARYVWASWSSHTIKLIFIIFLPHAGDAASHVIFSRDLFDFHTFMTRHKDTWEMQLGRREVCRLNVRVYSLVGKRSLCTAVPLLCSCRNLLPLSPLISAPSLSSSLVCLKLP